MHCKKIMFLAYYETAASYKMNKWKINALKPFERETLMLYMPFPFFLDLFGCFSICLGCQKLFRWVEIRWNGELLMHDGREKNLKTLTPFFSPHLQPTQYLGQRWLIDFQYLFSLFVRKFWVLAEHMLNTIFSNFFCVLVWSHG